MNDKIACAPNFRGVDGIRLGSGAAILPGRLYRSDAIIAPSPEDKSLLDACNIGLVIDLRSSTERATATTGNWADLDMLTVDMLANLEGGHDPWTGLRNSPDAQAAKASMLTLYGGFPAALHGQLNTVVGRMLAASGAALIHCTAGKDRTGFMVAILLAALGVARSDIFENYMQSAGRANLAARTATERLALARTGFALPADAIDALMSVDEAYLAQSFTVVERDHGGVGNYVRSAGLTARRLADLEGRLAG